MNTAVLAASAVALHRAVGQARAGIATSAGRLLVVAAALGWAFLTVQGSEWARMVRWGLTAGGSPYGGIVYVLIGTHGLHVLGAVVWLVTLLPVGRRPLPAMSRLEACALYWYFVCGLWLVIFPVVYLA